MQALTSEKVDFLILKAREFDVKVEVDDPDPGSNASDDGMVAVLEDYADDPTLGTEPGGAEGNPHTGWNSGRNG